MTPLALIRQGLGCFWMGVLATCLGCGEVFRHDAPGILSTVQEAELGTDFLLYLPSNYDRNHTWPLVIVCHSGFPDSPRLQINDWTELAEVQGFLVAAPSLQSRSGGKLTRLEAQLANQSRDEQRILAVVRQLQGSHNISEDRIFIFGWKGGAVPALFVGLRNPRVFRAIAVTQPKFDQSYFARLHGKLDPNQPVFVSYGIDDFVTGKQAKSCAEWLRNAGADVRVDAVRSADRSDAQRPVAFFRTVITKEQWVHIVVSTNASNPLEVSFRVMGTIRPIRYHWQFGDGDESLLPDPMHIYKKVGDFTVVLTLEDSNGTKVQRAVELTMPGGRLRPIPVPTKR